MEFNITARRFDLSSNLREYVIEKFSKLDKYFRGTARAEVTMVVEKHRQIIEISLHGNKTNFIGKEESGDMYSSIDALVSSMVKQIKRNKEKRWDRVTKVGKFSETLVKESNAAELNAPDLEDTSDLEDVPRFRIIPEKKFALKPMSVDEAALQLYVMSEHFLVFRDAQTDKINVLYRRKDNNFGLIEPEI
ncbi:MAG: ribosomal subunit interface protein [Candidatus Cloacimonetes bacterium 4572_55]|nr:MAG: ribosomal subunit interface protein [Candidatus Cloacimonetes bacterium 4572_55]